MTERAPRGLAVLETCLYAANLDATAEFYQEVLGLKAFSSVSGRHVFFRAGRGVFLLFNPEKTSVLGGEVPPHGSFGPGHVAFAVPAEELSVWRKRLTEAGIDIDAEVTWPGGGSSLYVRDPAGNSVELTSPTIWSIDEQDVFA